MRKLTTYIQEGFYKNINTEIVSYEKNTEYSIGTVLEINPPYIEKRTHAIIEVRRPGTPCTECVLCDWCCDYVKFTKNGPRPFCSEKVRKDKTDIIYKEITL